MALAFPTNPEEAEVIALVKERTGDNQPSQVIAIVEYKDGNGDPVGRRKISISPGMLSDLIKSGDLVVPAEYDEEANGDYAEYKLRQLWDAVPEPAASVFTAVRNQLPDKVFTDAWR